MLGIDSKAARSAWAHALVYAAVLVLICLIWVIRKTLLVFATALMFAYLLYPFVDGIDRRLSLKTRTAAVAVPFAFILCVLAILGYFAKGPLRSEYTSLQRDIKEKGFKQEVMGFNPWNLPIGETIVNVFDESQIVGFMPQIRNALSTGARYVFNFFIIPILSFFILKDGRKIRDRLLEMFDSKRQAESVLADAHALLLEYMRALLLLCVATLFSFTVALSLLRVPYPLLISLVAFPLEFVPLVGPLTSALLIISVSAFYHYQHIPWLILFLVVYRLFQDYVLSPHLMNKGVKLHPLLVLFGVFAGGEIGNVPGIFLSVPVLALGRLVFYEWHKRRLISESQKGFEVIEETKC
jgi:predicted PurR-regulated permease PerM